MPEEFQCRSCDSCDGELVLDLGELPLANNLLREEDLGKPEPCFPLRVAVCTRCWLLQITDLVPPVELFEKYIYFSSNALSWVRYAEECARRYITEFSLGPNRRVVEVASNDGYLLKHFLAAGVPHLGVEPAENIAAVAREQGIETRVGFFGESLARELAVEGQKADLILGNNVFAHAPDTNDFVAGFRELLQPNGRVILEFPYAVELLERNEFDTIYHEHVFYFSLAALEPIFERQGLRVARVERTPMHGGSLRLFAGHEAAVEPDATVAALRREEAEHGVTEPAFYKSFSERVVRLRKAICGHVAEASAAGSLAAYGAAAKGTTLLNYCGLGREAIEFVVDISPHKQGCYMPGVHLPILPLEALHERRPDCLLLLAWNFAAEIMTQQAGYRDAGGRFLIPVPEPRFT